MSSAIEVSTLNRQRRRHVRRNGRADARKNIPDLEAPGSPPPFIGRLASECRHNLEWIGRSFFEDPELREVNAELARLRAQFRHLLDLESAAAADQAEAEAAAAQVPDDPDNPGTADSPAAQAGRLVRKARAETDQIRAQRTEVDQQLDATLVRRHHRAEAFRAQARAIRDLFSAEQDLYYTANLRRRRRRARKPLTAAVLVVIDLPRFVTDDDVLDRCDEPVHKNGLASA